MAEAFLTRALLDELLRARAVEVLPSQKIRARTSLAIDRGINPQAIKALEIALAI